MASVSNRVYDLIKETVEQQGVTLWDVRFLKEGASHYLRVYIDKPQGISIDDCSAVSHAIDPLIDEADPIDIPYYLEVCSPGIERELTRDEHFKLCENMQVLVKVFKAINGEKEFRGILKCSENGIILETSSGEMAFEKSALARVTLSEEI